MMMLMMMKIILYQLNQYYVFIPSILLLWLPLSSNCLEEIISVYPTNYFTETVKKCVNHRPTIGIVPMPLRGQKILVEYPQAERKEYFGASFVKLVESAGGRAVPLTEVCLFFFIRILFFRNTVLYQLINIQFWRYQVGRYQGGRFVRLGGRR